MKTAGAILLIIGGLVHLIPALYDWLSELTGGTAWIAMIVGAVSVIVGAAMVVGGEKDTSPKKPPASTM